MYYLFTLSLLGWIIIFYITDQKRFLLKNLALFFIIDIIISFLNLQFDIKITNKIYIYELILTLYCFFCKIISNRKNDTIDERNVYLIFYKSKTLKQCLLSLFGLSYCSAGLIIKNHIYQMRYGFDTLQKLPLRKDKIKEKYLIVKTDIKYKDLKGNWEEQLLQQKARQIGTLFFRFNCLKSLQSVINLSKNYNYICGIFPSIYLIILDCRNFIKKCYKGK